MTDPSARPRDARRLRSPLDHPMAIAMAIPLVLALSACGGSGAAAEDTSPPQSPPEVASGDGAGSGSPGEQQPADAGGDVAGVGAESGSQQPESAAPETQQPAARQPVAQQPAAQQPATEPGEDSKADPYQGDWDRELNRDQVAALQDPFPLGEQMPPSPGGGTTLPDGTVVEILRSGQPGPEVRPFDTVRFRYAAFKTDGTPLQDNVGDPLCKHMREDFLHKAVQEGDKTPITGVAAAVRKMTPGTRARIYVPVGSDAGPVRELVDPGDGFRPGLQTPGQKPEPFPVVIDLALLDVIPRPDMPSLADDAGEWLTGPEGLRYRYLKRGDGDPIPPHHGIEMSFALWNEVPWLLHYTQQERGRVGMIRGVVGQFPVEVANVLGAEMRLGDRVVADVPPELAFGSAGNRGVPPDSRTRWVLEVEAQLPSPPPPDFEGQDVERTESGLEYYVIEAGGGRRPEAGEIVVADYGGWLEDGSTFDNSWISGRPLSAAIGDSIIKGWQEGLQLMPVGSTYAFRIPPELGYGERASRSIPANSTLIFRIHLRAVDPVLGQFRTPNPEQANATKSGLRYEELASGDGAQPGPDDVVMVHYTGWLADSGQKFDSSIDRGRAAEFAVGGVIPGWTEGLQLMREGGHFLFYIPSQLAYGKDGSGSKIPPDADLVFAVRLIKVLR